MYTHVYYGTNRDVAWVGRVGIYIFARKTAITRVKSNHVIFTVSSNGNDKLNIL